jgi:hypothetical protein
MALAGGGLALSFRASDVLGAWIYNSSPVHGFLYCAIATTIVYALILPVIPFVPRELIATADGQPNPQAEAQLLAEIGGNGQPAAGAATDRKDALPRAWRGRNGKMRET